MQESKKHKGAGEIAREKTARSTEGMEAMSAGEIRQALLELQVHDTMLRIRNEELLLAQEELDKSRTRYFDLYDLAPVGYCTLNESGVILKANLAAATLLGVTRAELVSKQISSLILEDDRDIYYRHRKQLFETGQPQVCELRMQKKDTTTFWVHLEAGGATDDDGAPECRVVMSDITARKKADAEIREMLAMIESVPTSIVVHDADGNFLYANQSALDLHGFNREEFMAANLHQITVPVSAEQVSSRIQEMFLSGEGAFEVEHFKKDGTIVPLLINVKKTIWNGNNVFLSVQTDITERRQAEDAIQASEKRYRIEAQNLERHIERSRAREAALYKTLADKSFSGVFLIQDKLFAHMTKQAADYYGYDVEELIGTSPEKIVLPEDYAIIRSMAVDMLRGKRTSPYEYRVMAKDQTIRWIMETVSAVSFNGRPAILGNCIDITGRRHHEIHDLHFQKLEAVGQLAAGIAHEINTPIQFVGDNVTFMKGAFQDILSLSALLDAVNKEDLSNAAVAGDILARIHKKGEEIDFAYLSKEIPKAIEQSLDGLQRVSKIVLAMRDFSHPGGEGLSDMDINKAIVSTITLSRNEWKYWADLTTTLDPDLPMVQGYPADFNQVILNIIVNAAQALQEKVGKKGAQKERIEISTRQDGNEVEICIRDTGPGIPQEIQKRVFDPFFTTKEVGKGTGQGLAIAQNIIVHKHGGKLYFATKPGEGTAFYIRLPLPRETDMVDET